jgi:catechol 2,3-dioxygenase
MERNDVSAPQLFKIDPSMKIGYVSLNVSDIQRSIDFYKSVLGFKIINRTSSGKALLSSGGADSPYLLELLQVEDSASVLPAARRAGLYHFAILLPERKHLADMLRNLSNKRDQVRFDGLAEHLVSEAIYIRDPDSNGIEIYRDRPYSEWKWSNGSQLQMATLPLNRADLLKESTEKGWKEMPAGTRIGHVHLHVRNLAKAMKFYQEILGLDLITTYPGAYFFAAGGYHHHIAANTWLGTNIEPASSENLGLNHFGIELPSKEYDRIVKRLAQYKMGVLQDNNSQESRSVFLRDYDGITIRLFVKGL